MAKTVPPVQLDNFVDILCGELCRERMLSVRSILVGITMGEIEKKLKEPGVRDIINLGSKAGLLTKKMGKRLFTDDGIRICNILKEEGKGPKLWSDLNRCLQRIDVYREFIDFLREPKKEQEAKEFMGKKTTAKCILRWLKTMKMLNKYEDGSVKYAPLEGREAITEEEFLNALKETYEEKAIAAGPMWRGTFVAIRELREAVCRNLKKIDFDRFDELLRQLILEDKPDNIKVRLAKGTAASYGRAGDSVFEFNGEKFLYIALNEVQND